MFSLMANCFAWLKGGNKTVREIKLVIIGLDDAGKTTTVACLQGEPPDGITPTIGFSNASLKVGKWDITLYDLGGGSSVRSVWEKYYADVYGILFAVDSGNEERLEDSRTVLGDVFKNSKVKGKPVAVFANKQDIEGALNEKQIAEQLELRELSEQYSFTFNVFPCSALKGYGKQIDKSIMTGLRWLLDAIEKDYAVIHEKVEKESAIQKEQEAKERKERMERIRKLREEREKAAKEAGVQEEEEESDDDVVTGSNPFRNINDQIEITAKREKKAKENMKRIKAYQETKMQSEDTNNIKELTETTEMKRSTKKESRKKHIEEEDEEEEEGEEDDDDQVVMHVPRITVQQPTPCVNEIRKKKKKKNIEKYELNNMENYELEEDKKQDTKKKKKKKKNIYIEDGNDDGDDINKDNDVDGICSDLEDMNIDNILNKKEKEKEEEAGYSGANVIYVSSQDNVRDDTPPPRVKKKRKKREDVDILNESTVGELPNFDHHHQKQTRYRVTNENDDGNDDGDDDFKPRKVKSEQEIIRHSRAEMFRARSYDSLQGNTNNQKSSNKKKKKKKKKKKVIVVVEDGADEEYVDKIIGERTKKSKNKSGPNSSYYVEETDVTSRHIWDSPPRENGHVSKLEPIRLRGRLPDIKNLESSSIPSWARAKTSNAFV
ncbi:ADP-ribosylation factor-like protein 13B [Hydractinia symbiolongicarpus]|uniref:ADP-ribosylation factor-like protein 13B n=1 Tax=Hydractinia symbiolongicarpus TaxID=13093 RepID=UPI00254DF0CD|nr:ADP-ribosylation factor-like protein 13B [Hydractinia symbiolongicarpus]